MGGYNDIYMRPWEKNLLFLFLIINCFDGREFPEKGAYELYLRELINRRINRRSSLYMMVQDMQDASGAKDQMQLHVGCMVQYMLGTSNPRTQDAQIVSLKQ